MAFAGRRVNESESGIVTPCSALKGRQDPGRRGWHWHCRRSSAYSSVRGLVIDPSLLPRHHSGRGLRQQRLSSSSPKGPRRSGYIAAPSPAAPAASPGRRAPAAAAARPAGLQAHSREDCGDGEVIGGAQHRCIAVLRSRCLVGFRVLSVSGLAAVAAALLV